METTLESTDSRKSIRNSDWDNISDLLEDIKKVERRNQFLQAFFQWDILVKLFRKVEMARIILAEPTQSEMRYHAECLHKLLACGYSLLRGIESISEQVILEAYVEELELTLRMWHPGPGPVDCDLKELEKRMFSWPDTQS